jgi:hypothetical protein
MLILQSNYVAGIVDGEGTIGLNEHRNNYYNINITIPNTNLDLLKYIRNVTKLGNISKGLKQKEIHKICYFYRIRKYEAKKFLIIILPYLIIKKRQAELILQYLSLRKANKWHLLMAKAA